MVRLLPYSRTMKTGLLSRQILWWCYTIWSRQVKIRKQGEVRFSDWEEMVIVEMKTLPILSDSQVQVIQYQISEKKRIRKQELHKTRGFLYHFDNSYLHPLWNSLHFIVFIECLTCVPKKQWISWDYSQFISLISVPLAIMLVI